MNRAALSFVVVLVALPACFGAVDSDRVYGGLAVDSEEHAYYVVNRYDGDPIVEPCVKLGGGCPSGSEYESSQVYLTTVDGDKIEGGEPFGPERVGHFGPLYYSSKQGFVLFTKGVESDAPEIHRLDGTVDTLPGLAETLGEVVLSRDGTLVVGVVILPNEDRELHFYDTDTLDLVHVYRGAIPYEQTWDYNGLYLLEEGVNGGVRVVVEIDPRSGTERIIEFEACVLGRTGGGGYRQSDGKILRPGDGLPLRFEERPLPLPCMFR